MPARYLCLRTRHACPYQTAFAMPARGPAAGAHCARVLRQDGFGGGIPLLDAVRAVLAQPTHKVCHGALEALPELMQLGERMFWGALIRLLPALPAASCNTVAWLFAGLSPTSVGDARSAPPVCPAGVRLGGQLEDPRAAGALLWPDAAAEDPSKLDLKRMQASVAPQFKVLELCCRLSASSCACLPAILVFASHCLPPALTAVL